MSVERRRQNSMQRIIIFLIAGVLCTGSLYGQTADCAKNLSDAQTFFDLGNLSRVDVDKLNKCIDSKGFTPEENVRAHRLITLVYLYLDDQPKADEWMVKLLKTDKEHKFDEVNDPKEIHFLHEKFRSKPIFRARLGGGANVTRPVILTEFGTENTADVNREGYSSPIALHGGVELEKEFYGTELDGRLKMLKGFALGAGVYYSTRSFLSNNINRIEEDTVSGSVSNDETNVSETQTWLEAPFFVKYSHYTNSKIAPFGMLGVTIGYLNASNLNNPQRTPIDASNIPIPSQDLIKQKVRNQFNWFLFAGGGLKYSIGTHFLVIDVRYLKGMGHVANGDNRYLINSDLLYDVSYVDNNFTINSLMVSLGYQRSIYNIKKIKP